MYYIGSKIRSEVSPKYGYDTKGRVTDILETIAGSNFPTSFTFDNLGRLSTRTHPSAIVETMHYNSYGYMDYISAGGETRFTITGKNARGQLTGSTYGSNLPAINEFDTYGYPKSTSTGTIQDYRYSFNPVTGNLNWRQNFSLSESFSYTDNGDNLDRLTSVTGPQNLTMTYNANGNILTKSDISSTTAFGYGTDAGPYALTGVTSSTGVIPPDPQTATYTSFEKVNSLDEGSYSAVFVYNNENQRAKMDVTQSGTNILTRWYAGSSYMKEIAGGVTKEYTYIGGDAYSAPVAAITQSGTTTYYYLLRDYLGNITHQVNTSNTVVAEYSYDAWGRRRNPTDWSYDLTGQPALFADRGFTGHEYLPWFNLYNMNGRLYDPAVGRFMNVDPYVQDAGLTQSYNRYSYCLNNPLRYTDPSGYKWNWNWINPLYWFSEGMQAINDNTKGLRKEMTKAGIPAFNAGSTVNGAGNVNFNGSINNQPVFNTANIDRSNAVQVVNKEITQVIQDYGPAWLGTTGSIAEELYYSKTYGTWMGKNFTLYKQTFHGNGSVGGMNKFGKTTSNYIKWGGRALGAWNIYSINEERRNGQIDNTQWVLEQGTNAYSTLGGIYGAAWGVGWGAGRAITNTNWYQEAKFNFWYNRWESQVGSPSQSNEVL